MVKVYHNSDFIAFAVRNDVEVNPAKLTLVAEMDAGSLDEAFHMTNNIEEAWANDQTIVVHNAGPYGHRSTSVGDVVEMDGNFYLCGSVGWKLLEGFKL